MSDNPNITHATDENFDQEVIQHDGYVFVDFWAEWCTPCKALEPEVEKLANEQAGNLKVVKVDVDENPQIAGKYQVMSIPTMMLLTPEKNEEGKRKAVFTMGFRPLPALMDWLKQSGYEPEAAAAEEESTESEESE